MRHGYYILATTFCWFALAIYWFWKSRNVKATVYSQSKASKYIYRFFLVVGFAMVYARSIAVGWLGYQIVPANDLFGIIGLCLAFAGVAFAIWARKTLGDNWSAQVTFKQSHSLVQSGPYRFARHPIYTGILTGLLGTAITVGQVKCFIGLAIIFAGYLHKTTLEEAIMGKEFPEQYAKYSQRVKRLIPFIF